MRIGIGQMNATVGDLAGNAARIIDFAGRARVAGCDLVVFPELVVTGYPPQDLLFKEQFVTEQLALVHGQLAAELALPAVFGFVDRDAQGNQFNAAAVCSDGRVADIVHKSLLPTYDVFDEWRYFRPAAERHLVPLNGVAVGITICEDIWDEGYDIKTVDILAGQGAELILNLSSSPFHAGKRRRRLELCRRHATATGLPVVYCNLVGAQDELIFDGESLAVDGGGRLIAIGPQFREELVIVDCLAQGAPAPELDLPAREQDEEVFNALVIGISDYLRKTGFTSVAIGLSGGIDSALVACLAAEALGPENVSCLAMPSRYTSDASNDDAALLAQRLGVHYHVVPIEDSIQLAVQRYNGVFGPYRQQVTVENLQARERGKILMELSNDSGALVLATGNKTEYALGYSTLYGDMCGGLAVIGDVSKPDVYALAKYYNRRCGAEVIPARIIERPPSAELRADQVDPFDYDTISPLCDAIVEDHASREECLQQGYTAADTDMVFRLVRINEYKRRQAPPILRVTQKAFGLGRKMPIVNKYLY